MQQRHYGVLLATMGGVCLSASGLIIRLIEQADAWQILFYRSIAFSLTVLAFIFISRHDQSESLLSAFLAVGYKGLIVAAALASGFTFYVLAMLLTTVANVVFILSTGPFFAALLGLLVLRERVDLITWLAMVIAAVGLGMMVIEDMTPGALLGNLTAMAAAMSFAIVLVTLRSAGQRDMMPATCLAGVFAALFAALMLDDFVISANDLVLSILLGSVQIGFGFILLTLGTRYLPAAEVALLAMTETVLAPVWVWLVVGETPALLVLTGGLIILAALAGQGLYRLRREPVAV